MFSFSSLTSYFSNTAPDLDKTMNQDQTPESFPESTINKNDPEIVEIHSSPVLKPAATPNPVAIPKCDIRKFLSEGTTIKKNNHTIYWFRLKVDAEPILIWDITVKHDLELNNCTTEYAEIYDLVKDVNYDVNTLGPYDFTQEEIQEIHSKKLAVSKCPVLVHSNFVQSSFNSKKSFDDCLDYLRLLMDDDCWSVYTRTCTHEVEKVYFDSRKYTRKSEENDANEEFVRNNFETIAQDALRDNLTICVFLGGVSSSDTYFYPNSDRKSFDIVQNNYS
jgi:hypothetical protein